ncbi:MAG: NlpC/P60 family protein, partial [Actinomycetota bacterium]|nr:NlpC/P60 family protein [Actinomycetota bacterium]
QIADKKAEAARIAADLDAQGNKVSLAAEQFNQAQLKVAAVQSSLAKVKGNLARADERMQSAKGVLAQVAVQSYVSGGSTSFFAHLASSNQDDLVLRTQYLRFTAADQRDALGQVRAAREDFSAAQARLDDEEKVSAGVASAAEAAKRQAADAEAAQRNLLGQVNGELTQLVATETAARMAAQAAAAPPALKVGASAALNGGPTPTNAPAGVRIGPSADQPAAPGPRQQASIPAPPSSGGAGTAVAAAEAEVGKPYVYGAAGPDSYDCSGLMLWAWGKAGVSLSHSAQMQYSETTRVSVSDMQPGDIIFFGSSTGSIGHDAMYVGDGQMVEAAHTGTNIRIVPVRDGIVGAGRPG